MKRVLSASLMLAILGAVSCGGASVFPEPAACSTPTPLPTATGRAASNPYFAAVRVSVDRVASLREQLRSTYPGDKFSRASQFRLDFAAYAQNTVCLAESVRDLKPANPSFEAYDRDLDSALDALIEHTNAGREAVRKRNVSDYRLWYNEVDLKIDAVKVAANSRRTP